MSWLRRLRKCVAPRPPRPGYCARAGVPHRRARRRAGSRGPLAGGGPPPRATPVRQHGAPGGTHAGRAGACAEYSDRRGSHCRAAAGAAGSEVRSGSGPARRLDARSRRTYPDTVLARRTLGVAAQPRLEAGQAATDQTRARSRTPKRLLRRLPRRGGTPRVGAIVPVSTFGLLRSNAVT
jgi:hypothetical protein